MAGIEKVCEYSGEYPGSAMYGYKRNLIQVMPEYRNLFKGVASTLIIFKREVKPLDMDYWIIENGKYFFFRPIMRKPGWLIPVRVSKPRTLVDYALVTTVKPLDDEASTDGLYKYYNWTYDVGVARRKLKRLVGSKFLTIINSELTQAEWYSEYN